MDADLESRREGCAPQPPRYERGALAKYAKLVGSASRGAVCDQPLPKHTSGMNGPVVTKSLTFDQVEAVMKASENTPMYAYVVLSLLIGARTEESRALTRDHVDLVGKPEAAPVVLPSISVWRSVREGGDTKTEKSWRMLDSHNVRRAFRRVVKAAGPNAKEWTPREMRHSFVSVLSASGVKIDDIARLVGHSSTTVTETVYRHQIVPVMQHAAITMNDIFRWPVRPLSLV